MPIGAIILSVDVPRDAAPGSPVSVTIGAANSGLVSGYCYGQLDIKYDGQQETITTIGKTFPIGAYRLLTLRFTMPHAIVTVLPSVYVMETLMTPPYLGAFWPPDTIMVAAGEIRAGIVDFQCPSEIDSGSKVRVSVTLGNLGSSEGWIKPFLGWWVNGVETLVYSTSELLAPGETHTWYFERWMPPSTLAVRVYAYHWDPATATDVLDQTFPICAIKHIPYVPPPDGYDLTELLDAIANRTIEVDVKLYNLDYAIDNLRRDLPPTIEAQTNSWWSTTWQTVDAVIRSTAAALTGDIDQVKSAQAYLERLWRDLDFTWPNVGAYMLDFLPGARPIVDIWDAINLLKGWMDDFDLDLGNLLTNPIDWLWDRLWDWLNTEVEP